jgi:hypothetical protein
VNWGLLGPRWRTVLGALVIAVAVAVIASATVFSTPSVRFDCQYTTGRVPASYVPAGEHPSLDCVRTTTRP